MSTQSLLGDARRLGLSPQLRQQIAKALRGTAEPYAVLAKRFGVCANQIYLIRKAAGIPGRKRLRGRAFHIRPSSGPVTGSATLSQIIDLSESTQQRYSAYAGFWRQRGIAPAPFEVWERALRSLGDTGPAVVPRRVRGMHE